MHAWVRGRGPSFVSSAVYAALAGCALVLSNSGGAACAAQSQASAKATPTQGTPAKVTMTDAQIEANVLRALAGAPELSTQNIQSATVYGTVTLTGTVHDEALRGRAEDLVSRADGVKKVIDEMTLGDAPPTTDSDPALANMAPGDPGAGNQPGEVLQSDGSYAPSPQPSTGTETTAQSGEPNRAPSASSPTSGNQAQGYDQPQPYAPPYNGQRGNSSPGPYQRSPYPPAYGQAGRSAYGAYQGGGYDAAPYGGNGSSAGQIAGMAATVPSGTSLQIRIDRGIDSNHIQPGTNFTGTVLNDVSAAGVIAVPRGASVQGIVVDAKRAGALKGEGELALQLTALTLGGQTYPLSTAVWDRAGRDKTLGTVNTALGLGALGAVFGGLAGGGAGAAIGAGVGGAVGVGAAAASPGGRVIVPPEAVLTFSLAQPLAVKTVSQSEMQRLAYAAGPGPNRQVLVRRRYYPAYGPYGPYGPVYAPYGYGGYGPYGYPYGGYFYRR